MLGLLKWLTFAHFLTMRLRVLLLVTLLLIYQIPFVATFIVPLVLVDLGVNLHQLLELGASEKYQTLLIHSLVRLLIPTLTAVTLE